MSDRVALKVVTRQPPPPLLVLLPLPPSPVPLLLLRRPTDSGDGCPPCGDVPVSSWCIREASSEAGASSRPSSHTSRSGALRLPPAQPQRSW